MSRDERGGGGKKRAAVEGVHTAKSSNKQTADAVDRNIQAIVDLERKTLEDRKQFSRLSEVATKIAASPAFIAGHMGVFAAWIVLNTTRFAFDRNPFNLLNLILTLETIVLTSIVLVAQRDLKRLADLRGHLDLQVNILAEQELTAILGLLNRICDRLGIDPRDTEPDVEQFAEDTDVRTIATAIEKKLDD